MQDNALVLGSCKPCQRRSLPATLQHATQPFQYTLSTVLSPHHAVLHHTSHITHHSSLITMSRIVTGSSGRARFCPSARCCTQYPAIGIGYRVSAGYDYARVDAYTTSRHSNQKDRLDRTRSLPYSTQRIGSTGHD